MTLCRCGKPALYRVGPDGFCAVHHYEACRQQAAVICAQEAGRAEYEQTTRNIERGSRAHDLRFRTRRPHP